MKNIVFILALLAGLNAVAQITLDHTYANYTGLSETQPGEYNFYYYNTTNSSCAVNNSNHQLIESIPISLSSIEYLASITYLSSYLFDSDSDLEMLITTNYWQYGDTAWYLNYNSRVIDNNGSVLLDLPGAQYVDVVNLETGSYMLVWIYDLTQSSYPYETRVYNLPGQYSEIPKNEGDEIFNAKAFPNPASFDVYLPTTESTAKITIYNANGTPIDELNSEGTSLVKYSVRHLPAGIYFFEEITTEGQLFRNKFIIR